MVVSLIYFCILSFKVVFYNLAFALYMLEYELNTSSSANPATTPYILYRFLCIAPDFV